MTTIVDLEWYLGAVLATIAKELGIDEILFKTPAELKQDLRVQYPQIADIFEEFVKAYKANNENLTTQTYDACVSIREKLVKAMEELKSS